MMIPCLFERRWVVKNLMKLLRIFFVADRLLDRIIFATSSVVSDHSRSVCSFEDREKSIDFEELQTAGNSNIFMGCCGNFLQIPLHILHATLPRKVLPPCNGLSQELQGIMRQCFGKHIYTLTLGANFLNNCCLAQDAHVARDFRNQNQVCGRLVKWCKHCGEQTKLLSGIAMGIPNAMG